MNTDHIHELTRAEVKRKREPLEARLREIIAERAAIYANPKSRAEGGGLIDVDERAAREHAKALLNGHAPAFLSEALPITRERELAREQRGLEIVLKVLDDKNLIALAAEAVAWAETHRDQWRAIWREIVMTVTRLEALERNARGLVAQCPDMTAIRFPMCNLLGPWPVAESSLSDLQDAALSEGIVTKSDLKKAGTC